LKPATIKILIIPSSIPETLIGVLKTLRTKNINPKQTRTTNIDTAILYVKKTFKLFAKTSLP
jgi:hypothetical protein